MRFQRERHFGTRVPRAPVRPPRRGVGPLRTTTVRLCGGRCPGVANRIGRTAQAPDDVTAWLYRVVRNKAISASRSIRRRKRHEAEAADRRPVWFERSQAERIDAKAATVALQSLPQDQREVVVARVWGELSFEQIGRLVGVSDSAAHRRYKAALSALRQKLGISTDSVLK